jgi:nicotinamidase/pyrazinamidase
MGKEKALIIVDMQNDFCPGGALEVKEGDRIIETINSLAGRFEVVVATQDWHPPEHRSFASAHPGKRPFDLIELNGRKQTLWPPHCIQGTWGAELVKDLDQTRIRTIFRKGMDPDVDSYSGFRDNLKEAVTGLDGYLRSLGIRDIYICGLATDFCVYFTAMDGLEMGYGVWIILDGTKGIDLPRGSLDEKLERFRRDGGKVITSSEVHP